jgi:hypothetical protein
MKSSSDGSRPEKKLPTIDELRKTAAENQYELKVKDFFLGKQETSASSSAIILPPVDSYSQQTIRLSIVNEKVMTWSVYFLLLLININFQFDLVSNKYLLMIMDKQ